MRDIITSIKVVFLTFLILEILTSSLFLIPIITGILIFFSVVVVAYVLVALINQDDKDT